MMDTPPPADALGSALDDALRGQLSAVQEPDDAGFSLRVMAALPARRSSAWRWARALRYLHWTALSLAAAGLATLTAEGLGDPAQAGASLALLALLCLWAIPSRWNRG